MTLTHMWIARPQDTRCFVRISSRCTSACMQSSRRWCTRKMEQEAGKATVRWSTLLVMHAVSQVRLGLWVPNPPYAVAAWRKSAAFSAETLYDTCARAWQ